MPTATNRSPLLRQPGHHRPNLPHRPWMRQPPRPSPHIRSTGIILQQPPQGLQQTLLVQLGFDNHLRRPSRHKRLRILPLVVIRGLWKRHQYRRPPRRSHLRHRTGPAPAKNQVCCSNLFHHPIEIRLHSYPALYTLTQQSGPFIRLPRRNTMPSPSLVHNLQLWGCLQ